MKILSLETSTKTFSLALNSDQKILASRHFKLTKVLSSSIIPAIDGILKKGKMALKGLDGFAVGLGPGSFTSLRVGLSTVKGLAFVTGKPVVGISSLDVLAMNAPLEVDVPICVVCDARRNLVYSCLYRRSKNGIERTSEYLLMEIDEVLNKIKGPAFFVGDGIGLYKEKILAARPESFQTLLAKEKDWYPKASHLAQLAYPRFLKKKFDAVDKIVPLYLYPEDCQIQRNP
ncbi:MAG TPA: tRNA (adenosine(37)-N6)-threonylcarbamoyltransferase complex dimerization subunit type 1 TsaB [Candidatus Omnitrophota bacterium]|nr:tRNA (adenosine(37)-N6)-threonylcarbamoyltransferase complex dimerization subunit type 1 TsaB [Candidatus Omnitrophota bacterium]